MQSLASVQETLAKDPIAPRFGMEMVDQADPFHCSANGVLQLPQAALTLPTAMHVSAELQLTPVNDELPVGLGIGTIDQADPFHCSANVVELPAGPF